jgi:hypothetical protein
LIRDLEIECPITHLITGWIKLHQIILIKYIYNDIIKKIIREMGFESNLVVGGVAIAAIAVTGGLAVYIVNNQRNKNHPTSLQAHPAPQKTQNQPPVLLVEPSSYYHLRSPFFRRFHSRRHH